MPILAKVLLLLLGIPLVCLNILMWRLVVWEYNARVSIFGISLGIALWLTAIEVLVGLLMVLK
jgi:hypothetical protein